MNRKLITIFSIFTILPVGLITWMGVQSVRAEHERNRQERTASAYRRLELLGRTLESEFLRLENELLALTPFRNLDSDKIREATREQPYIRQGFVFGTDGSLRFPSEDEPLSAQETEFLERTREIGLSPGLFHGQDESRASARYGWYTWYLGEGINFIFWRRTGPGADTPSGSESEVGEIEGFELNRMAVIARIIRALPHEIPGGEDLPGNRQSDVGGAEEPAVSAGGTYRIVLEDISGRIVYQWGGYDPEEDDEARAAVPAPHPISAWRLRSFSRPYDGRITPARKAALAAPFVALALGVAGLAAFLYRESTRESREALKKVSFVNQVSHELKTPLTNIRMYAELLENRMPEEDPSARNYLSVVVSESNRLSRLISNVLTFGKEQKGTLPFTPVETEPDRVIAKVCETFAPILKSKGIEIQIDLDAPGPARVDPDILEQIASNLITNAEKYAAAGKYVGVRTLREEDTYILRVRDRGPGIPPSARERIFRPFFRLSNKLTDGTAGTGIGLYIVRNLARLHGGDARVLPTRAGAEIEVRLRAPVEGDYAAPDTPEEREEDK
jgi:signal transduction histidine kinase